MNAHSLAALLVLACSVALAQTPAGTFVPATQPAGLDRDWDALAGHEPEASTALLRLASAKPDELVAFLKPRLVPVRTTPEELAKLFEALKSPDEPTWKAASRQLEYFDPRLVVHLETIMDGVDNDPTLRRRVVEVLAGRPPGSFDGWDLKLRKFRDGDGYNFSDEDHGSIWAEADVARLNLGPDSAKPTWTRAVRAIALLEHLATPEARAIVDAMATGHPDAQPTRVAKGMIEGRGK